MTTMKIDETTLGPYLSRLPTELLLEIAFILCAQSQKNYVILLRVSRTLRDLCKLACLPVVPIVLDTPHRTTQFADYLRTGDQLAPRVRRLWIFRDHCGVISTCTNIVALTCDGHDLIPVTSSDPFRHTQLTDLTIMGLWDFWTPFASSKYGRSLCGQLHRLWLLDHLFLRGIEIEWLTSLRELTYWTIELREDRSQFKRELELLDALPGLARLRVLMRSPSPFVFSQLRQISDRRLEVISWGKRNEVVEWINQSV